MTIDEALKQISEQRARLAERRRTGVPAGVQLGTLTSTIRDGSEWTDEDEFPSYQFYADEAERVLSFAAASGVFERYLPKLRKNARQRDAALSELRVAFFLSRNEFVVEEWETVGASNREGEFTIKTPAGEKIFVEVKAPTWQGELSEEELLHSDRKQIGKYLHGETRAVAPWERIRFAVNKAYGKFRDDAPTLLIIADDLFIGLEHGQTHANLALYDSRKFDGPDGTNTKGYFTDSFRENLGGVGFFSVQYQRGELSYTMELFLNPYALTATALPEQFARAFNGYSPAN